MKVALVLAGLSLLALVHELGHAAAARALSLRILSFSFGLGPPLVRRRWGRIMLLCGPIPFGGYVRVAELTPEHQAADRYTGRNVAARLLATLAGPAASYLVAAVCAAAVAAGWGLETGRIRGLEVTAVTTEQATASGLRPGDVLTAVEGRPIKQIADLSPALEAAGPTAELSVQRDGAELKLRAQPLRAGQRWGLGARYIARPELRRADPLTAAGVGLAYPFGCSLGLLQNAAQLLVPGSEVRAVSPVGLADRVARSGAWDARRILSLGALLSVVVGLFNLLPVPGLDGGRLCLESVEAIVRRRLAPKQALGLQLTGVLVLLAAWLLLAARDIGALFR